MPVRVLSAISSIVIQSQRADGGTDWTLRDESRIDSKTRVYTSGTPHGCVVTVTVRVDKVNLFPRLHVALGLHWRLPAGSAIASQSGCPRPSSVRHPKPCRSASDSLHSRLSP